MSEESKSYPSVPDQAKNLAKFSFDVIRTALSPNSPSTSLMVSQEVREERMNTCRQCEYYDEKQVRCRHCGCYLEAKVSFAIDSCPLKKWTHSDENWISHEYEDILDRMAKPQEIKGPQFPVEPQLGELYSYEKQEWQYDGRIWRIVK
jgi:hypothetical protein